MTPNHRNEVESHGARFGHQTFEAASTTTALATAALGRAPTASDSLRLATFATGFYTKDMIAAANTAAATAIDTASTTLPWPDAESVGIWKDAAKAAFNRAVNDRARFPKPTGPAVSG